MNVVNMFSATKLHGHGELFFECVFQDVDWRAKYHTDHTGFGRSLFCRMKSDKIDFNVTHGLQAWLAISSFLGVPSHSLGFPCERHLMRGKNEVKNEVPTCTYAGRTVLHQVAKQCPIMEKWNVYPDIRNMYQSSMYEKSSPEGHACYWNQFVQLLARLLWRKMERRRQLPDHTGLDPKVQHKCIKCAAANGCNNNTEIHLS